MKDGEIVESGTHQELLVRQGHYHKLYTTASSGFNVDETYIEDKMSIEEKEEEIVGAGVAM